jgi:uncharacterized Zn-binding protein involved in type VI secretion
MKVARLNDTSTHGGQIVTASPDVIVNGRGCARDGDQLDCPIHGRQPITAITSKTFVNGRLVVTVGATAACGATISTGSDNVDWD